jgi:hypothetical protein
MNPPNDPAANRALKMRNRVFLLPFALLFFTICFTGPQAAFSQVVPPSRRLLWQIGLEDNLYHEFADYQAGPETVTIPEEGAVLGSQECAKISRGVRSSRNPIFEVKYRAGSVPQHGVLFSFKLLGAPKSGSQMAVFANGTMAGLIQFWGTEGADYPYRWRKTYRLYIPKEFLKEDWRGFS